VVFPNADECLKKLEENLHTLGLGTNKVFERKRKIMEAEVTKKAMNEVAID